MEVRGSKFVEEGGYCTGIDSVTHSGAEESRVGRDLRQDPVESLPSRVTEDETKEDAATGMEARIDMLGSRGDYRGAATISKGGVDSFGPVPPHKNSATSHSDRVAAPRLCGELHILRTPSGRSVAHQNLTPVIVAERAVRTLHRR